MQGNMLFGMTNNGIDYSRAVPLFDDPQHQIYWVGVHTGGEEIECNSYLVVDGGEGFLLEPGGYDRYLPILQKVNQVSSAMAVTHLLFSHQDPDICASLPHWMRTGGMKMKVVVPAQWTRFMPHYMAYDMAQLMATKLSYVPVPDGGASINLKNGGQLKCIPAPFLHSPGNMAVFDTVSGFLFSGDIGAAVYKDGKPRLVIDDWQEHVASMQGFHQRYMSSNKAVAGFVRKLNGVTIQAMVPQHGCIFRGEEVSRFFRWLERLTVGADYLYADIR